MAMVTVFVPNALAETVYDPLVRLAVNVDEVASPLLLVVATQEYV
jgi:hypothetical protein